MVAVLGHTPRTHWEQQTLDGGVCSLPDAESCDIRASRSKEYLFTEKIELLYGWALLLEFRLSQINFVTNCIILCQSSRSDFNTVTCRDSVGFYTCGSAYYNDGKVTNIHFASNGHPSSTRHPTHSTNGRAFSHPCISPSLHSSIPASLHPSIPPSLHPSIPPPIQLFRLFLLNPYYLPHSVLNTGERYRWDIISAFTDICSQRLHSLVVKIALQISILNVPNFSSPQGLLYPLTVS